MYYNTPTMPKQSFYIYLCLLLIALTGCAKRGTITGGPKDTLAPVITRSSPANMTTGFTGKQIRIDFNEFIKIKDVNKQLVISPPMNNAPDITPMGNASRYITIKLKDTLLPNTTYSFNFGQSITDNNEGNPYSQFKFIFSTGTYIDSLTLNGRIKDAYNKKPDNFITVMLYEANETFNDSTVYKEKPRYVTNTLDSMVNYSLQNLKEGKYYLFALKDQSSNYKFDPKSDKIAFLKDPITIPTDTVYQLELFKEQQPFKFIKPVQATSNRIITGYEGKVKPGDIKATVKNGSEDIRTLITKIPAKDSVQIWLPRNIKADSLTVALTHKDSIKNFNVRFKEMKAADSLTVAAAPSGNISFRDKFMLTPSTPIISIDESKISLCDKDSVAVKYTMAYNEYEQKLEFDFPREESDKYTFTLLPGALKDFYEKENDTLTYTLSTSTKDQYGNLRISLANVKRFPIILDILNAKGEPVITEYSTEQTKFVFDGIPADTYTIRITYDNNGNKEWDTGSYMEKRQPEEVYYFPEPQKVLQNWDVDGDIRLGD